MHMSRLQSISWCQEEMTRLNEPSEVSISDEGVYSSAGAMAWTKATLIALNFWQLCSASPDDLQWVNSSHFCVFAALTFLCKCVFVQALLNSRPLPSCFYNYPPPFLSWMTCLCAFDGWGSPLHPRCGLESRDGSCHYASHLFGRCSGNVSFQTGCLCRRTPCWTPAWNRGSFANVERVCWRGRLGNPCNSAWRDSRSLRPSETDQLQSVETWRISPDLEMDSYLNVCGLWTGTPLENGEH